MKSATHQTTKTISDTTGERPIDVVSEQAMDEGLWFIARTAPEAYLQSALRRLHLATEGTLPSRISTGGRGKLIRTSYVNPPIPCRSMDWQATFDRHDPDQLQPVGYGATELEAVTDLLESLKDSK